MPVSKEEERLIRALLQTLRLVRSRMIGRCAGHSPQAHLRAATLRFIRDADGPTMREIAGFLRIQAPTATAVASGLIRAGLARRASGTADRRIVRLRLTPSGRRELSRLERHVSESLLAILDGLDREDRGQLRRILEKIVSGTAGISNQ